MKIVVIFLLLLLPVFSWGQQNAQTFTTDSFYSQKEGNDTLSYINISHKYTWQVSVMDNDGTSRTFISNRPDTLASANIAKVVLSTSLAIPRPLLYRDFVLNYNYSGSLMMKLNGIAVFTTGEFASGRACRQRRLEQFGFFNFMFHDTLENLEITYIPHPRIKIYDLSLVVFQLGNGYDDYYQAAVINSRIVSFAFGFYYFAFGVIFLMLFFFFRENNENMYFSLFSFFISLAFFSSALPGLFFDTVSVWSAIIATEFICIFLARVFRNRDRSKVPLVIICIAAVICLCPPVTYHYAYFFSRSRDSIGLYVGGKVLFCYELYLTAYILIWGLRRRNKEANTIFVFSLITSLLYVLFPIITFFVPASRNVSFISWVQYVPNLGLCIFPIGYAIVLGKRNGDNQKQLLEKEKEKKRILENQKGSLEKEVALRTAEVVFQKEEIEKQHDELKIEKKKSDDLLLNILPAEVADELKETGHSEARFFNNVTVLFTDFVDFTKAGERMTPQELVDELHICFKTFDDIVSRHNIEKIKTIGDAYMAVCGLPLPVEGHAVNVVNAALEIVAFMAARKQQLKDKVFDIRVGIHSGSVVAGIVGVKKFAYDIWGDTVNTAARMEQSSEPGKVNISQSTFDLVKDVFTCTYRGEIDAKGKGMLKMYYVS